jgi:hypothetical protein
MLRWLTYWLATQWLNSLNDKFRRTWKILLSSVVPFMCIQNKSCRPCCHPTVVYELNRKIISTGRHCKATWSRIQYQADRNLASKYQLRSRLNIEFQSHRIPILRKMIKVPWANDSFNLHSPTKCSRVCDPVWYTGSMCFGSRVVNTNKNHSVFRPVYWNQWQSC